MRRILFFAALFVAGLMVLPASGATGTLAPTGKVQYFDNNGAICSSCRMFVYEAGTSTKAVTYSNAGLTSSNTNPVVLDSAGRAVIFLSSSSFKFVFAAAGSDDPPDSPIWTVDNVSAVPVSAVNVDVEGTAGEALAAGDCVYLSAGDGGRTAGRWYKSDSDNDYSSTTSSALGFAVNAISADSSGTIRTAGRVTGLASLSAGTVYYVAATAGALTSSAPTNARKVGVADSASTLITTQWLQPAEVTASLAGLVGTGANTMAGVKSFNDHGRFEPGTSTGTYANWSGAISVNVTDVGNVSTGEDDLMTYSLPANVLSADLKAIRVTAWGTYGATANTKQIKAYFAGTSVTIANHSVNTGDWAAEMTIVRTGASTQVLTGWHINRTDAVRVGTEATPAGDTTTALTIKFTGEATDNNDIVQKGMIVTVLN
jgi:hypothetical protein